jgi:hypothetical protein
VSTTELPRTVLQRSQSLSRLAALAIVGQLVLITTALLLPIWSEYSLIGDNISELALGRYGFVQAAAFLIAGLGTIGLAFAIRKLTVGSRGPSAARCWSLSTAPEQSCPLSSPPTASTTRPTCCRCRPSERSTPGWP